MTNVELKLGDDLPLRETPPGLPACEADLSTVLTMGGLGVAFAGGAFGMLLGVVPIILEGVSVLKILPVLIPVSLLLGFLFAAFFNVVAAILILLLNWSLGNALGPRLALSLVGSGTGFLAMAIPSYNSIIRYEISTNSLSLAVAIWLIVIFVAMLFGHIGALKAAGRGYPDLLKPNRSHYFKYRLQIRHIMAVTTWVAILIWLTSRLDKPFTLVVGFGMFLQIVMAGSVLLWCKMRS